MTGSNGQGEPGFRLRSRHFPNRFSPRLPRATLAVAAAALLLPAAGCRQRSRFIQSSLDNDTDQKLSIIEVDYPNASFGVSTLAPHGTYSYRFKPLASGPLQLSYTDGAGKAHTAAGPQVRENQGGRVDVRIGDNGAVSWNVTPSPGSKP